MVVILKDMRRFDLTCMYKIEISFLSNLWDVAVEIPQNLPEKMEINPKKLYSEICPTEKVTLRKQCLT
jgi:hypothetical protein